MNRQFAAFIVRRIRDEYRAGDVGTQRRRLHGQERSVRMLAVAHAWLVLAQKWRCNAHRKSEACELVVALERLSDNTAAFLEAAVAWIHLQVLLGLVVRVADLAVHEHCAAADFPQSFNFSGIQGILDFEKHDRHPCRRRPGEARRPRITQEDGRPSAPGVQARPSAGTEALEGPGYCR
jgi:hypothetical protein